MTIPPHTRVTAAPQRRLSRLVAASSIAVLVATGSLAAAAAATSAALPSTAPAGPSAGSSTGQWDLVGSEDFTRLDRSRWHVYDSRVTTDATSTARPWRAKVDGGALRLSAGRDKNGRWSTGTVGGWSWAEANRRFGRVDMRVKTDRGSGVGSNLMLWPDAQVGPPALELYSSPAAYASRQRAQQRTHFTDGTGAVRQRTTTKRANFSAWRTVSVRWSEESVTYLVDGVVTRVDTAAELVPQDKLWPLLRSSVERDARGKMPAGRKGATTSVDWIRVYEWEPTTSTEPTDPGTEPTPEGPVEPSPTAPTPETPTTTPPVTTPPTTPPVTTPPSTPPTTTPPTTPPSTPPSTPPTSPEPDPEWQSVGRDDFNGSRLDTSKWSTFSGVPGCCRDTVWAGDQVEVSDGELVLHNRLTPNGWRSGGVGGWKWKSTVQKYGRIDARMRFDKGTGFSAAGLTWPADNTWPPELDFYEIYETRGERNMMAQSTHYKKPSASSGRGVDQKFNEGKDFSQWHTISVRWSADELTYWIDGKMTRRITDREMIPQTAMWIGFQTHTHKMNGAWPTMPAGKDTVAFRVDWVEVFTAK